MAKSKPNVFVVVCIASREEYIDIIFASQAAAEKYIDKKRIPSDYRIEEWEVEQ